MKLLPKFLQFRKKSAACADSRYPHYYPLIMGLHDRLVHTGNVDVAAALSSNYYLQTQPLYDAIERIAFALSSIEPMIWDTKSEEWAEDNIITESVLTLLDKPDPDTTWSELFSNSARYFMLTGNIYWLGGGSVTQLPSEMRVIHPQHVNAQRAATDPYPTTYNVNEPWGSSTFLREDLTKKERQFRYYRRDKLLEVYHIKNFNPLSGSLFGLSPLNAIYYEIEQYRALSVHNLGLMRNGARAGLVIKPTMPLDPDTMQNIKAEINQVFSGEENAGRPMFLEGMLDVLDLGKNNREMDYVKLRKSIMDGIYSTFKIPLPMVSADRMTLSNYAVSQLMLYDHTVEHYANRIFEELTRFIMPRAGDTEGRYKITYNDRDISALETRRNEQVKLLKDIAANTPNELRLELGFDEMKEEGANKLYLPQNLVAISDETNEQMKEEELPTEEDEEPIEEKAYIKQFQEILKTYKKDGSPMFSKQEIDKLSDVL